MKFCILIHELKTLLRTCIQQTVLKKKQKKHATKCDNMQTVVFKNSPTHTYFSYCCGAYWEDCVQDGISIDLYLKLGTLELHD